MNQDRSTNSPQLDAAGLCQSLVILRASGLAIGPQKMLLGGVALVLLAAGNLLFGLLPFAPDHSINHNQQSSDFSLVTRGLSYAGLLPRHNVDLSFSWESAAFTLLTPVRTVVEPGRVIFQGGSSWSPLAFAWTQLLWTLIVWSLVGGALCRMNALQFAKKKRISVWEALKFSRRQLSSYMIAPLLPLSAVVILQVVNWFAGYCASMIPTAGTFMLGVAWIGVLFSGFLMAMLLIGIVAGWPLMIAAISVEDSDGFDGVSRAFGYLFDRPWNVVMSALLSLPVFAATRILVAIVVGVTVTLAAHAVSQGFESGPAGVSSDLNWQSATQMLEYCTPVVDGLEHSLAYTGSVTWPDSMPDQGILLWTCIPALLYVGFGPSFFWAATTITYFQVRQSDDGTPLDSVVDWTVKSAAIPTADLETKSDDQPDTA